MRLCSVKSGKFGQHIVCLKLPKVGKFIQHRFCGSSAAAGARGVGIRGSSAAAGACGVGIRGSSAAAGGRGVGIRGSSAAAGGVGIQHQQSSATTGTTFSLFKMANFYFTYFTLKNTFLNHFF